MTQHEEAGSEATGLVNGAALVTAGLLTASIDAVATAASPIFANRFIVHPSRVLM